MRIIESVAAIAAQSGGATSALEDFVSSGNITAYRPGVRLGRARMRDLRPREAPPGLSRSIVPGLASATAAAPFALPAPAAFSSLLLTLRHIFDRDVVRARAAPRS